jgi:hypothetical protein
MRANIYRITNQEKSEGFKGAIENINNEITFSDKNGTYSTSDFILTGVSLGFVVSADTETLAAAELYTDQSFIAPVFGDTFYMTGIDGLNYQVQISGGTFLISDI